MIKATHAGKVQYQKEHLRGDSPLQCIKDRASF